MANFFPRWSNWLPLKLLICAGVTGIGLTAGVSYYFTPKYTRVGYMPAQPVAFSHDIHANQLGMDCRYCHSFVEVAAHSNVPNTQVCMNCHTQVQAQNPKLQLVRDSYASGRPIEWVQIHKTPDYVYFNHSVHVNRGVSCYSCHGAVNQMPVVWHHEPQSMGWCLDCHRAPENHLRPTEQVFNLNWKPSDEKPENFVARFGKPPGDYKPDQPLTQQQIGLVLKKDWNVNPPDNCATCHR
jgi:hypothetical protein